MAEAIKLRAMAHSFEGKVYTIVSCSTISDEIIECMEAVVPDARVRLERRSSAFSGFIGPDGRLVGQPLIDDEGIVYAELDLGKCVAPKQMHDIVGHYNRFDVFDFAVNGRPLIPITWRDAVSPEREVTERRDRQRRGKHA
jgi:aliphatic nitrilase